jgi:hypothetical protein
MFLNYFYVDKIEKSKILSEDVSLDTIGNAFFARMIHTQPRRLFRLHMYFLFVFVMFKINDKNDNCFILELQTIFI